jgi:predicted transcriptional regulator
MTAQERGLEFRFPFRGRVMADALVTDQEIAILCDVMEGWGANLNEDKRKVVDQLIAKGFVVSADQESPAKYKLTSKAQQLLAERGVGLSGG